MLKVNVFHFHMKIDYIIIKFTEIQYEDSPENLTILFGKEKVYKWLQRWRYFNISIRLTGGQM